jgi:methyl-accepting chemotaxis protein
MRVIPTMIGGRLAAGYAAMLVFMALNIGVAWVQMDRLGAASKHLIDGLATREREARQWQSLLGGEALTANGILVTSDPDKLKPLLAEIKANDARIAELNSTYSKDADDPELSGRIAAAHKRHTAATTDFLQALESGSGDFLRSEFYEKFLPSLRGYQALLEQLAQRQQQLMDQGRASADLERERGIWIMLAIGLAACAVGSLLAWRLARSIRLALTEAVRVAHAVAEGDLTARSRVASQGELEQLFMAQERMCERLRATVASIKGSAEVVQQGSREIASGNNDLSARTEQQASTVQQTSAAMAQMTKAVRENADIATQASSLAGTASDNAVRRGEQMTELVRTMREMTSSSGKIAEITSVIDAIAFQTNILALNAAVEAARAGEQGRGFAVVADEVRMLAKRSSTAAREIRGLIDDNVQRVETGAKLATTAGDSIGELVQSVQSVAGLLQRVASSTGEQSQELAHINEAVASLDHVTQQNSAMVEQCAAAAGSLSDQAALLEEAVAVFKFAAPAR